MVERRTVAPDVAGSIPVTHPTLTVPRSTRHTGSPTATAGLKALATTAAWLVLVACGAGTSGAPGEQAVGGGAPGVGQTVAAERGTTPGGTGGVNAEATLDKPYLILISFDGFRHDYLARYDTPSFDRVSARGALAEALIPVYPSLTFPAHYSVATGLHPERHGLVGNRFYDPVRREQYDYRNDSNVQDGTWYGGEPIWVTAETQGMVAAAMLFVGTEADVGGVRPTFWTPYDERGSQRERVDQVLEWLSLPPDRRPHLVTLYFSAVDGAAHRSGPDSNAVARAVGQVDAALGRLLDGIDRLPHGDQVSLVLVSDHGMATVDPDLVADLRQLADLDGARVVVTGPGANLFVDGDLDRARRLRDDLNDDLEVGRAYLRAEVPAELHYRLDPRIGDVVVIPDHGAMLRLGGGGAPPAGMHGYDPRHPEMQGIFLVSGPDITAGERLGPVESVHLYPLMTRLLRLAPNPDIDGDLSVLEHLLRP